MKIKQSTIKQFEWEQEEYGTKVALTNILWQVAAGLFKDIDIRKIKTSLGRQNLALNRPKVKRKYKK